MGAVLVEPDQSRVVNRKTDPVTPPQPIRRTRDLFDGDAALHAGDAPELFSDEGGLQRSLRRECDVLPIAASAASRSCVRARGLHALGRRVDDLDRVSTEIGLGLFGEGGEHPLARQRVAHEDDPTVVGPRDAAPASRDRAGLELHHREKSTHVYRRLD